MSTAFGKKHCVKCRKVLPSSHFSVNQLKKAVSKCTACIQLENPQATPPRGLTAKDQFLTTGRRPYNGNMRFDSSSEEKSLSEIVEEEIGSKVQTRPPTDADFGFTEETIRFLHQLRKDHKLTRNYQDLPGEPVAERQMCHGCGLTLNPSQLRKYDLNATSNATPNVVCVLCKTNYEKLNIPLDITAQEKADLRAASLQKHFSDSLKAATSIGEMQMAFITRNHIEGYLIERANETSAKIAKAYLDAQNPDEPPADLFSLSRERKNKRT